MVKIKVSPVSRVFLLILLGSYLFGMTGRADAATDIIVTEIKVVQSSFQVNDLIQFDVTMKNQGSTATIASWLGFTVDVDGAYATWGGQNAALAAGAQVTFRSDWWKATKTLFQMSAFADFPDFYSESDEQNNALSLPYPPPPAITGVDLIVTEVKVVQMGVVSGDKINFDVFVKNQGNTTLNTVWCGVYVYLNGVYATWGGQNISLSPGGTVRIRTKYGTASGTNFTMEGQADFSSAVAESNEANNRSSFSYASPAVTYQGSLASGGWNLKWSDEFSNNGSPDPAKWGYEYGYVRNNEKQFFTNRQENARVENGNLIIEARKESYNITNAVGAYGNTLTEYTSASLITQNKAAWTYGRMDILAKIPTARGIWPALWTLGTNVNTVGWPKCGEIDILEHVGWDVGAAHTSIHTQERNHSMGTEYSVPTWLTSLGSNYDLYSTEWDATKIVFFINGRRVAQYDNKQTGEDNWPFFRDQYLLMTLSVGGSWGGVEGIDEAVFPQKFLIDYVRIYQK